jgi:uncharacterized RDD family membrane protein YckC
MISPDETISIQTPENVAFGYEVADIGSRFMAAAIDTIFITILQILTLVLLIFSFTSTGMNLESMGNVGVWSAALFGLLAFAFFWGYYIFFELIWNGQTPGKRWVGLRVIREDGIPVGLVEVLIRNLVRLVDFLPFYYGIGLVTMFLNSRARRLGDLAAGTLVVMDRKSLTLASLEGPSLPPSTPSGGLQKVEPVDGLPVELLDDRDLRVAEDYLKRRNRLFNRAELSAEIARQLSEKMGLPGSFARFPDGENFIIRTVRAYQARHSR